jgi:hypothetical protein
MFDYFLKKDQPLEDIVIHLDPSTANLDQLFNFIDQLSLRSRLFVQFHRHASIQSDLNVNVKLRNRLDNFDDLFEQLQLSLNGSRSTYDHAFTFIWKKCNC